MKRRNRKKLIEIIILLIIFLIAIGLVGIIRKNFSPKDDVVKIVKNNTEKYIAYIKTNSSIKLEYSYTCTLYSDGSEKCNEPKVYNYELVNDAAKETFKNVNILQNSSNLSNVIELIIKTVKENNINIKAVEIQTNWNKLDSYLKKNIQNIDDNNNTKEYSISVNFKEENSIMNNIKSDVEKERTAK